MSEQLFALFDNEPTPVRPQDVVEHARTRLEEYIADSHQNEDSRVLRSKQLDVMEDLHGFLQNTEGDLHGYISLPTGVGKTVLFTELVKATGLRTLVLTPTKLLLGQTESAFNAFGDEEVSVGKIYSGEKNGSEDITLTTYASFVRQSKQKDSPIIRPDKYDLIILDEAHRALAVETRKALVNYFGSILIGFTATEEYSDRRKLASLLPKEIHKMPIKEAIEHNLIAPFTNIVVKAGADMSMVKITAINEYDVEDLDHALNNTRRNHLVADFYTEHLRGLKGITFCHGVAHAEAMAEIFRATGVRAMAVHGGMSTTQQDEAKRRLQLASGEGALDMLTNDKLLTEGFDVPAIAVGLNASPTLSQVRAQQRGGRVLRLDPAEPKKHAYIVDFVDEHYRKGPVLFADPKVAGEAQIGDNSHSIFLRGVPKQFNEDVEVIADPVKVAEMAATFHTSRKIERRLAPERWLSAGQVAALYHTDYNKARTELANAARDFPQYTGEFNTRGGKSKTGKYYFSPEVVQLYAEREGKTFVDFDRVKPYDWVTRDDLLEEYSPQVLRSMVHFARVLEAGLLYDHSVTYNDIEYYSPRLVRVLEKYSKPLGNWRSVEELCDEYYTDEVEIEQISRDMAKASGMEGLRAHWLMQDYREELFLSPVAYENIEMELKERLLHKKVEAPILLVEGEVVEISKNNEDRGLKDLYALFD